MRADAILMQHKDEAVRRWTEAIFALYPFETTGFMRTNKDRFTNPVGHATARAARVLYDVIAGLDEAAKADPETSVSSFLPGMSELDALPPSSPLSCLSPQANEALADLIRIRAVQDMPAHEAVGALFLLKPILRDLLLTEMLTLGELERFLDMESRLDSLVLMAFSLYVKDREALFAQRVDDIRRECSQLKRWAARHGFDG